MNRKELRTYTARNFRAARVLAYDIDSLTTFIVTGDVERAAALLDVILPRMQEHVGWTEIFHMRVESEGLAARITKLQSQLRRDLGCALAWSTIACSSEIVATLLGRLGDRLRGVR
jgi:hypothetical protein